MLALSASTSAHADYQDAVLKDSPKAYYRLNDDTSRTLINKNIGVLGAAGNATNDLVDAGVLHPFPGAIAGDGNRAVFFDFTTRTEIPWNAAVNTPNTQPFSVEAWFYPATDQTATGMSPLANRWAQGGNRQGWVMYQRKPDSSYLGGEQVGWEFRMYNDLDTSGHLDVTSLVPYEVGKWQHVVVVYDPVGGDPLNATLTIYINGVAANTNINTSGVQGYYPVTNDHDPAPNGQPALALGNYNNANSALNPWFGGMDEFAYYSNKLSADQILAHYQNGTNAARSTSYDALIKSQNPVVYLRLDEIAPGTDVAVNLGDVRNAGLATHSAEVRHPAQSALAGRSDDGAVAYHNRNGNSVTTLPFLAANNGQDPANPTMNHAGIPFTFEAWLRPMRDQQGGQCPVNNRMVGGTARTGWVIFQRNPNLSYPPSEGRGWNFRMFNGGNNSGQDILTDTDYEIGKWQHLVVTWEPQVDNGDVSGNGNDQWQGILTGYVDGVPVATNTSALYAANRQVPEPGQNGDVPADLGIGGYNAASGLGSNPYEGDIDEFAIYNNYLLTPEQILAHYMAGTNANYGTNYETLVFTAGFTGPERVGLPATYLRFNDPARFPAANSGTAGHQADGTLILTTNVIAGPQAPAYAGFGTSNLALPLDGLKQWASLNNPASLNISGQITLEAWIKPDATQIDSARIISHGPPTRSDFLGAALVPDLAVTNTTEVFLRIDGAGTSYVVGSAVVTYTNNLEISSNVYSASFDIPAGDLGGANWIHLAGTYDGTKWSLYRNGQSVATSTTAVGAVPVLNGDWAIGATGQGWAENFAGAVDEVAIYDTALTPQQISAHYVMGQSGAMAITITRAGTSNVTITWPTGTTLQEAATVAGPYTNVTGSPTSPLTIPASGTKFYRWSQ
jgi:hypothetical protein